MTQALQLMKLWHNKLIVTIESTPLNLKNLLLVGSLQNFSTCAVRRSSRSKMNEPHVTGTKSFARLAHEVAMNNNGVYPTRGEMYVTTRTRKDGSVVDDKAAEVVASLKAITSDCTITTSDFTNDDYSKVKGPEKWGMSGLSEGCRP